MNAYLPSLAKDSPEVAEIRAQLDLAQDHSEPAPSDNPEAPLIAREESEQQPSPLKTKYETELSRATSRISSLGIAVNQHSSRVNLLIILGGIWRRNSPPDSNPHSRHPNERQHILPPSCY